MDVASRAPSMVEDPVTMRRVSRLAFPSSVLVADDGQVIAGLGRDSFLNIYFGRGRKVRLGDGTTWRIRGVNSRRYILPMISSSERTLVYAGPLGGRRSYGITGRDYGYSLLPMGRVGWRRPNQWSLRRHDSDVASIDDRRRRLTPTGPLPVPVVLMAFTLIVHGIPGEEDLG